MVTITISITTIMQQQANSNTAAPWASPTPLLWLITTHYPSVRGQQQILTRDQPRKSQIPYSIRISTGQQINLRTFLRHCHNSSNLINKRIKVIIVALISTFDIRLSYSAASNYAGPSQQADTGYGGPTEAPDSYGAPQADPVSSYDAPAPSYGAGKKPVFVSRI